MSTLVGVALPLLAAVGHAAAQGWAPYQSPSPSPDWPIGGARAPWGYGSPGNGWGNGYGPRPPSSISYPWTIAPSRNHPPATTSLTGVPPYTYTSPPGYTSSAYSSSASGVSSSGSRSPSSSRYPSSSSTSTASGVSSSASSSSSSSGHSSSFSTSYASGVSSSGSITSSSSSYYPGSSSASSSGASSSSSTFSSLSGYHPYSSTSSVSGVSTSSCPTSSCPPYPTTTSNGTLPACKPIQYNFPTGTGSNATRAAAIVEMYEYAWYAYVKYAFGHDELLPLSASYQDNWYGWGVTIVDGIDTAIVMNLTDIVAQQLAFIETIDFNTTPYGPVEIFDTSIRYLGGLLSAYDLLKSGQFYNNYPQAQINALLTQAISLADKIAFGFNTPTGLSSANVNFTADTPVYGTYTIGNTTYNATNTASGGTFILDWFRLSDLTGNETYRLLTERAENYFINPSPAPVYPGLVGTEFDIDNGQMLTFDGGWEAGVDSFLEYLIKTYQYQQGAGPTTQYKDFWLQAAQSTIGHLALHPYGFPNLTFLSYLDVNGSIALAQDDFSCFAGGSFLLGAQLLDMPDLIGLGVATTDGCHQTYNQTLTGLGPINWAWYNSSNLAYNPLDNNDAAERKFATQHGFFITQGSENWEFRPEAIESIFYGHRITGDPRWAEYNWQIAQAINNTARNNIAFAEVVNVDMPYGGYQGDFMDSFFFAEVLKYLYLTFSDPNLINLEQWVLNTECHPLLVQCGIGNIDDYITGEAVISGNQTAARRH